MIPEELPPVLPTEAAPTAILLIYLTAAVLFILGIRMLSSPKTARRGNLVAATGMVLAVVATFFLPGLGNLALILVALVIGSVAGIAGARVVQMTDMPQMVALLNGLGGGAAGLISIAEYAHSASAGVPLTGAALGATLFGTVVGSVAFTGSIVAFGKLQGIVSDRGIPTALLKIVNGLLAIAIIALVISIAVGSAEGSIFFGLAAAALVFGVLLVMPIGGADMPVVISLLNSCTGLAAASTGFVLHNVALIIGGTLVGASGALLTQLMCKAMNRSLANVLFGGMGTGAAGPSGDGKTGGSVRDIGVEDAAILMANSQSVIIVPGYGMAVAQAQHAVRELADELIASGTDVRYAIHPVAGRMPGHMNVLLAEANVPYSQLFDLDDINPEFGHTDVALVIGANDVVNPAARTDRTSPIFGMPILDVDHAQHVIVIKRSLNPGFAGIDNPLYYDEKTYMLFGDAKGVTTKLVEAVRESVA